MDSRRSWFFGLSSFLGGVVKNFMVRTLEVIGESIALAIFVVVCLADLAFDLVKWLAPRRAG